MGSVWFVLVFGAITPSSQACTHLNWAHDLTIRTLKPSFFTCFGSYIDSLSTSTQPDKVTGVPPLRFTSEKVQIPPLLSTAKQYHLCSPALQCCVRCMQVPGPQRLCPRLSAKAELFLNFFIAVCTVTGCLARQLLL